MPRIVPFAIGQEQALHSFETWNSAHWLAPRKLLTDGLRHLRAELLPFWLFEATTHVSYSGGALSRPSAACRAWHL